jgi:hypothetical protein
VTAESPLPTFLVIGAMKAGTSSLFNYLAAHPQVFMPAQKEVHYFTRDDWDTASAFEWYSAMFAGEASRRSLARGEASPGYSRYPQAPEVSARIRKVIPDVRLVYVIRDPVERIVSHHRHNVAFAGERRAVADIIEDEWEYVATSRYGSQIARYRDHFPADQLLVITSERLRSDRTGTVAAICRFIGVDAALLPETIDREFNTSEHDHRRWPRPVERLVGSAPHRLAKRVTPARLRRAVVATAMRPAPRLDDAAHTLTATDRARLVDALRPDLELLQRQLGPTFDAWGLLAPAGDR